MDRSLAEYLNVHKDILELTPNNRIKCIPSGHEMPLNIVAIEEYLNSNKLRKILEWYSYDYSRFEPLIIPHKSSNKHLYCVLTKMKLNKVPEELENHIKGKKYLRYIIDIFMFIIDI